MSVIISSSSLMSGSSALVRYGSLALLSGTVLLTGCQKKVSHTKAPSQVVSVYKVHRQSVAMETSLPGRVEAYEQAQIRPQVSGVIVSRNFEQGKDVKAGQPLYQVYVAPYQAAYDQAKGRLAEAQASAYRAERQLKRYRGLVGPRAVSRQDYDNMVATTRQAEAEVIQAKAALESAAVNLNYTHVQSPIDGRIGRTLYTEGTLVTANQEQPIAVVTRLDPIYVDINLAAEDMLRLRREMAQGRLERKGNDAAVSIELPDGSSYGPTGRLALSEVTVDPGTGTLIMRAVMPNAERLLLPGMFVHAYVHEGTDPNGLLVPQLAVQRNTRSDPYVMVVNEQNKVQIRMITVGRTIESMWQVKSGLKDGDRVIVKGLQKAKSGATVTPREISAEQSGAE